MTDTSLPSPAGPPSPADSPAPPKAAGRYLGRFPVPRRGAWLSVLALALLVRLGGAVWWQARLPAKQPLRFSDSDTYVSLGRALAQGEPYQYGTPDLQIFRAPGYPLLLAGVFRVLGPDASPLALRIVGALLGVASVALVGWLGREVFGPPVGWCAAALAAVYPGAIAMSIFLLSEGPFCPWMLLTLIAWLRADRSGKGDRSGQGDRGGQGDRPIAATGRPAWRRWAPAVCWALAAGAAAGVGSLTRPSWFLFLPFAGGAVLLCGRRRFQRLALLACLAIGCSLVMLPWWIRNYQLTGTWVPTTLQVGASLYDGLNPEATGASNMAFARPFYEDQKRQDAAAGRTDPCELRLDRRLRNEALRWAAAHPRQVATLAWIKFQRMWNPWPNEASFRNLAFRLVVACGYLPLIGFAILGLVRSRSGGFAVWICVLPAAYFTCLHMLFVSSIRYRQPPMLALIVLAAAGLSICGVLRRR